MLSSFLLLICCCLHRHNTGYMLVFSSPTFKLKNVFWLYTNAARLKNLMLVKYFEIFQNLKFWKNCKVEKQCCWITSPETIKKPLKPLRISLNISKVYTSIIAFSAMHRNDLQPHDFQSSSSWVTFPSSITSERFTSPGMGNEPDDDDEPEHMLSLSPRSLSLLLFLGFSPFIFTEMSSSESSLIPNTCHLVVISERLSSPLLSYLGTICLQMASLKGMFLLK